MGRKLVGDVSAQHPKTLQVETFANGTDEEDLPAWARKAITNPYAWDDMPIRDERVLLIRGRLSANGATDGQVEAFVANLTSDEKVEEALVRTQDVDALREAIQDAPSESTEPAGDFELWVEGETYDEYVARAQAANLEPLAPLEWEAAAVPNTPETPTPEP